MYLPPDIIGNKAIKIERWQAFYAMLPDGSPKEHYCIIADIPDESEYLYVYITSQENSVRAALSSDPGAVVELEINEVAVLNPYNPKKSFIKCDRANLRRLRRDVMQEKISKSEWQLLSVTPDVIRNKICKAILNSRTHSKAFKERFRIKD
jgi:hypothetical protein